MTLLTIFMVWLITIASLAIGFMVALYLQAPQTFRKIMQLPKRKTTTIGPVNRPTAEQVNRRGSIVEEGTEEFARHLRKLGIKPEQP